MSDTAWDDVREVVADLRALRVLADDEAARVIDAVAERWVANRGATWWWSALRDGAEPARRVEYGDADPWETLIEELVPARDTYVLVVSDERAEPYGAVEGTLQVLAGLSYLSIAFEWILTTPDAEFALFDTHHDQLVLVPAAAAQHVVAPPASAELRSTDGWVTATLTPVPGAMTAHDVLVCALEIRTCFWDLREPGVLGELVRDSTVRFEQLPLVRAELVALRDALAAWLALPMPAWRETPLHGDFALAAEQSGRCDLQLRPGDRPGGVDLTLVVAVAGSEHRFRKRTDNSALARFTGELTALLDA